MKVIETAESPAKLTLYFISYSYIGWAALAGPQWPRPTDPHYRHSVLLLLSVPLCDQNFLQKFVLSF